MSYPIEIISLGERDNYDDIIAAAELLNSVQREFNFAAPPLRLRGDGFRYQPRDANGYHTHDAFDFLRDYRQKAHGHRPFLIGVVDGKLRSDRLVNLFGSHEAKEGLAVISLDQDESYTKSGLQFLSYYLVRYALSFIHPEIHSHEPPKPRDCFFHLKRDKRDLALSVQSGSICPECMRALNARLSVEDYSAIRAMIDAMKNPSTKPHADIAIITVVTEQTRAVVKALERDKAYYRESTGSESDRTYYKGRLSSKDGGFHSIACTQTLKQGNRPIASAYSHIVAEYKPHLVVLLDIGGAIHKDIDLCDVVFADSVWYYDQRKETSDGTLHRGQSYPIEPRLHALLNAFFVEHDEPASFDASISSLRDTMRVLKGPIASGEAVVAYREAPVRQWLRQVNDKILALETEAGGLAEVFEEEQLSRAYKANAYLVVRGISDHADKEKDDKWRRPAAENAMIALEKFLAMMPIFPTSARKD